MASCVIFIILTALMVTSLTAILLTDDYVKCKAKPGLIEKEAKSIGACYKNVTEKDDFNATKFNPSDLQENQQRVMCICLAKDKGIISSDGSKYNATLAIAAIDNFDVTDDTKAQLIRGINECAKPENNGFVFLNCNKEVADKVCKA